MEIQFLGTGAGLPSKNRNVTSIALKLLDEINEVWLFDCGEATQHMILHTAIKPRKVTKIFITHLHGDHIFGLPGFLSSRTFQAGDCPVTIYGPKGIKEYVETSIRLSQSRLGYPIHYKEFTDGGELIDDAKFKVLTLKLDHGIPSFGYRIVEKDHPGELQADRLKELGVPYGPLFGKLKQGQTIELEDGRLIDGKDYISEPKRGRIVTILGDTRCCENAAKLAGNADVLVHEATFEASEKGLAKRYFHSTSHQAAQVANQAQAKKLLLTHISSRYVGYLAKELEKEAKQVFANSTIVNDLDIIPVPFSD
ncbi:ribonuclease Z [Granulicatella seriolae]|uniref:Ribonuclease Z n=1 Tax=Granulicatella seriolae TaxID=2967226 RepID=A0ABT1WK79_9LACT|nr:ribonuclease Z [Granulicatella seriolae]